MWQCVSLDVCVNKCVGSFTQQRHIWLLPKTFSPLCGLGDVQKHKNSIFIYRAGEENSKRLSNLWGESQRPINQPVMKVSFPTGRRQKANCAGLRGPHPFPAPAGIFMSREEETAFQERKSLEERRTFDSSFVLLHPVRKPCFHFFPVWNFANSVHAT